LTSFLSIRRDVPDCGDTLNLKEKRQTACAVFVIASMICAAAYAAGCGVGATAADAPSSTCGTSAPGADSITQVAEEEFNINQTLSGTAQRNTIAFDALAFLTGDLGADTFLPPGKVADMWGFQYLRDNDATKMGHNTDFLSKAANNVLSVLSDEQKAELVALAKAQVGEINEYAYDRFLLIDAFCRLLAGDVPEGSDGLDMDAVQEYSADLYELDGHICIERAEVMGHILHSLDSEQRAYLDALDGVGMLNWPDVGQQIDPRTMTHDEHVAVMTYAGDLLSWYLGSTEADVYFCPERQGTYFGSFYLKDAPAMGNDNYTIDEKLTGDSGALFLSMLSSEQAEIITDLVDSQLPYLLSIVALREDVSILLRESITGGALGEDEVLQAMRDYGSMDGAIVFSYATAFAEVNATLSEAQRDSIAALRAKLGVGVPEGAYLYSSPIDMPEIPNTDFLFAADGQSAPSAPTALAAIAGDGEVSLSWGLPADDGGLTVDGYLIYQDDAMVAEVRGALTATVTGLENGRTYAFSVAAFNSIGTGTRASASATPATVPDAPGMISAAASGSKVTITWSAPAWDGGADVTAYKVIYGNASAPDGQTMEIPATAMSAEVSGLQYGVVYSFKVVASNSIGDSMPSSSATAYAVPAAPFIIVTAPNGGESWDAGTTHTITWASRNNPGAYVRIELMSGGAVALTISSKARNSGSYSWAMPYSIVPGEYQVRVRSATSTASDCSDAKFLVPTPSLTVTSPAGGEQWTTGRSYEIAWSSAHLSGNVKLELVKGTTATLIVSNTPNDGSFTWTVPRTLAAGSAYQIRVSSAANSAWKATSQAFAVVAAPTPSLTLVSPNGGEVWTAGTQHAVAWTSANDPGELVRIELYRGGRKVMTLASTTANDGLFEWTIPANLAAGNTYQIRIVSLIDTSVYDKSDGTFSITQVAR
jgi:hypothetical protein